MEKESYTQADVDLALARVAAGEKKTAIARTSPVPLRTNFRPLKRASDIHYSGPLRQDIITKSSTMLAVAAGRSVPTRNTPMRILTGGCYQRFLQHHPSLSNRIAQCIARVRSAVDGESISILFNTLAKLFIVMKIDGTRITKL
ncbi:hypothetical protein JG688_00015290, partial [Phytophthora aleatoria]